MIPATLRILGKTVTVKHAPLKSDEDAGECKHRECVLTVTPKQSLDNQRDTLLHEIMHFVSQEADIKLSERQVRLSATVLLAVLRDNPALVAFLTNADP